MASVASFVSWPGGRRQKATFSGASLFICIVALLAGDESFQAAFNECVVRGESVRSELSAFRRAHGAFPATLGELPEAPPCKRVVLPSALHYKRALGGYELEFGDWLVVHRASESVPFQASK